MINYTGNTDIIVDGSSLGGAAGDTDSLTLYGTDPANPSSSGDDTFNADFTRAGTPGNEWVQVSDSNGSQTEVSGEGLKPGLKVVTGQLAAGTTAQ